MEGQVTSDNGYCLWAGLQDSGTEPLSDGIVDEEGNAVFTIHYSALYFNLFRDEVIDGIVDEIKPSVILTFKFFLFFFRVE